MPGNTGSGSRARPERPPTASGATAIPPASWAAEEPGGGGRQGQTEQQGSTHDATLLRVARRDGAMLDGMRAARCEAVHDRREKWRAGPRLTRCRRTARRCGGAGCAPRAGAAAARPGPPRPTHSREPGGTSTTGPSSAGPSSSPRSGSVGRGMAAAEGLDLVAVPADADGPPVHGLAARPARADAADVAVHRPAGQRAGGSGAAEDDHRQDGRGEQEESAFGMTSLLTSGMSARGPSRPPGGIGRSREDVGPGSAGGRRRPGRWRG